MCFAQEVSPESPSEDPEVQWNWSPTRPVGPLHLRNTNWAQICHTHFSDQEEMPTTLKRRLWPKKSLAAYARAMMFIVLWDFLEQEDGFMGQLCWVSKSRLPSLLAFSPHISLKLLYSYQGIDLSQMSLNTFFKTFYLSRWPYHFPSSTSNLSSTKQSQRLVQNIDAPFPQHALCWTCPSPVFSFLSASLSPSRKPLLVMRIKRP